jgi:hypothetical protein
LTLTQNFGESSLLEKIINKNAKFGTISFFKGEIISTSQSREDAK